MSAMPSRIEVALNVLMCAALFVGVVVPSLAIAVYAVTKAYTRARGTTWLDMLKKLRAKKES